MAGRGGVEEDVVVSGLSLLLHLHTLTVYRYMYLMMHYTVCVLLHRCCRVCSLCTFVLLFLLMPCSPAAYLYRVTCHR